MKSQNQGERCIGLCVCVSNLRAGNMGFLVAELYVKRHTYSYKKILNISRLPERAKLKRSEEDRDLAHVK